MDKMKKNSKIAFNTAKAAPKTVKGEKNAPQVGVVEILDVPQKPKASKGSARSGSSARPSARASGKAASSQDAAPQQGSRKKKLAPVAPDDESLHDGPVLDVDELESADEHDDDDELELEPHDDQDDILDTALDVDMDEPPLPLEEGREGGVPAPASTRLPAVGTRDSLHLYLREINRFPLLQPEEEVEVAHRVRDTGDPDAAFRQSPPP